MRRTGLFAFVLLMVCAFAQSDPSTEFQGMEDVWNQAHLTGDASALEKLWADEIEIVVPRMAVLHKSDALGFFKSGKIKFQKYESSDLRIRVYHDAAVVTGALLRERTMGEKTMTDHWRFTKVYSKKNGDWKVVSFHASEAAPES